MKSVYPAGRRRLSAARALITAVAGGAAVVAIATPAAAAPARLVPLAAIPFTTAAVTDPAGGSVTVSWTAPAVRSVRVYEGATPVRTDRYVGGGHGTGKLTVRVPAGAHEYFRLVPDRGASLTVSQRGFGLASDPNLRDVGGYRTTSGQWVRENVLYRSGALSLTPADLKVVNGLGIRAVADLRTPGEIATTPDVVPAGARYHNFNMTGEASTGSPSIPTEAAAVQLLVDGERQMVLSDASKQALHDLFTTLAYSPGAGLFNCSAGKDRTGWSTAVLLTLLGVPSDVVMKDYLLSNTYYFNSPGVQQTLASLPPATAAIYTHLLDVEPQYLQAGLDQVKATYGSMTGYALRGLKLSPLTLALLKAKLLTGTPARVA
ncbi:tyrosine-protein phosphatase [Actinoplanes sp. TBRC 11911]|uniref:tyrosine-protein phosphatase n=1 Tax=Actinoplanes sp. TBRC 11911 TaxID=2729386 RepID=UPI00145E034A|nr:tyrosine-protein phosphatase [Actinoplanes sp. TBRC 11911]NMO55425.1 tyrosine-protein phosphatase [Actinoplanes sp. TBRC 11911]